MAEGALGQEILKFLREAGPRGLGLPRITEELRNNGFRISDRTVRRALDRLVASGLVASLPRYTGRPGRPERIYVLREHLPRQVPLIAELDGEARVDAVRTLDEHDLRETEERSRWDQPEAYAAVSVLRKIAAGQLQEERVAHAIIEAAPELAKEDPVNLLLDMAEVLLADINHKAVEYVTALRSGRFGSAEDTARTLDLQIFQVRRLFRDILHLGPDCLVLPTTNEIRRSAASATARLLNREEARKRLRLRVRGDRVVRLAGVEDLPVRIKTRNFAIAGTDVSVADILLYHREGSFLPPRPVHVFAGAAALAASTVPSGISYVDYDIDPDRLERYDDERAAEEGYIIAPHLREYFAEDDLRHAKYAALSLRQYDEELRVLRDQADWRPVGRAPSLGVPPPIVLLIRDGRIFPTVHRFKDFESPGLYGRLVRRELSRFYEVAHLVGPATGPKSRVVYAGVVKTPEFTWLPPLVFYYLYRTGRIPTTELVYRSPIPDPLVAHLLFLGLARTNRGRFADRSVFRTFGLLRRFSDIADPGPIPPPDLPEFDEDDPSSWKRYVERRLEQLKREGRVVEPDVEDYHDIIQLCSRVGALMVYAAPAGMYRPILHGSDGHFLVPRWEVLAWLPELHRAESNLEALLCWISQGRLVPDEDHAWFEEAPAAQLFPLVPDVVVEAHEAAKFARTDFAEQIEETIRRLIRQMKQRTSLQRRRRTHP